MTTDYLKFLTMSSISLILASKNKKREKVDIVSIGYRET